MLCKHNIKMASGHSSVTKRWPYPIKNESLA